MESHLFSTISALKNKKRILFLTTSNRWKDEHGGEQPKSTQLAHHLAQIVGKEKVTLIDIPSLNIFPCEGNVSTARGNTCGLKDALLADKEKNPSGNHRCWASINNPSDELWKVSKALLMSEAVVFFTSVRWGQTNSMYQKLIERLTWLENRHSTLKEDNILGHIDAGIIVTGHNWRGKEVLETEKEVLSYFGFQVKDQLCWNWQYLQDSSNESNEEYVKDNEIFKEIYLNEDKV